MTGNRGMWGAPRPAKDPNLHSPAWRKAREYWRAEGRRQGIGCWRCRGALGPILYDVPYYVTLPSGKRKANPRAYTLGHITGRDLAASLGWTDEQINALGNCLPEHAH